MSTLKNLQQVKSLHDFSLLLGYKPKALAYLLYKMDSSKKYRKFDIPKKSGGVRTISAPNRELKKLQQHLKNLLYDCLEEIEQADPKPAISHGFRRKCSIVTNARPHKGRRYVLNLDIENFFPSINFGRVRGFFLKDHRFQLNEKAATIIAQIACHENALPQGSPCSPIISDLVGNVLDARLVKLAKKNKVTYSRYADDITFSTNRKQFPSALATESESQDGLWTLGGELISRIIDTGFEVNDKKTRMQVRMRRQTVTGLTVNEKVNIPADYYRYARSMCHSLFNTGKYHKPGLVPVFPADPVSGLPSGEFATSRRLEGIVSHIYFVKNAEDKRTSADKKKNPTAARKLYKRLLFFKYFVELDKPLIICEGETDSIYLRSAIHQLPAYHSSLAEKSADELKSRVKFFNYATRATEILQLSGGTGELKFLIRDYSNMLGQYKFQPLSHPVILLTDNDDGAKQIFSIIKEKFGIKISLNTKKKFYHLYRNLYLVKTPEIGTDGTSMIEDFFEKAVLKTKVDGKSFNPADDRDNGKEYGKVVFAKQVVLSNKDKINFSKFGRLLNRIVAVLDDYKATAGVP